MNIIIKLRNSPDKCVRRNYEHFLKCSLRFGHTWQGTGPEKALRMRRHGHLTFCPPDKMPRLYGVARGYFRLELCLSAYDRRRPANYFSVGQILQFLPSVRCCIDFHNVLFSRTKRPAQSGSDFGAVHAQPN